MADIIAHSRPRLISFTEESTFNETQTDFDNNGELFYVIDPNVEGLKQSVVDNQNSVARPGEKHSLIRSLKSAGAYSFGCYLHGNSTVADSGSQAAEFHLSKLLKNAMGGAQRSYHYGLAGTHNTGSIELESTFHLAVGMWLWVYDDDVAEATPAKIVDIAANVCTLNPPLPFAPTDDDVAYAAINCYLDWDSLTDHTDTQHTTLGIYIKGEDDADSYRMQGCKLNAVLNALEAGNPTMVNFEGQAVQFDNSGLSAPDMTGSISGDAPLAVATGDDTRFYFGDTNQTGSLTETDVFTIEPILGITHQQVQGPNGTEGVHHYNVNAAPGETGLTITKLYDTSHATEFEADTQKQALIQVGTTNDGKPFAIYFPRLEYAEDPSRAVSADRTAMTLVFRAHENNADDTGLSGDTKESFKSAVEVIFFA